MFIKTIFSISILLFSLNANDLIFRDIKTSLTTPITKAEVMKYYSTLIGEKTTAYKYFQQSIDFRFPHRKLHISNNHKFSILSNLIANKLDFRNIKIDSTIPTKKPEVMRYLLTRNDKKVTIYEHFQKKANFKFKGSKLRISNSYKRLMAKMKAESKKLMCKVSLLDYAKTLNDLLPSPFLHYFLKPEAQNGNHLIKETIDLITNIAYTLEYCDILKYASNAGMSYEKTPDELEDEGLLLISEYASQIVDEIESIYGAAPDSKISDYGYKGHELENSRDVSTIQTSVHDFSKLHFSLAGIALDISLYDVSMSIKDSKAILQSINYIKYNEYLKWNDKLTILKDYSKEVFDLLKKREYI